MGGYLEIVVSEGERCKGRGGVGEEVRERLRAAGVDAVRREREVAEVRQQRSGQRGEEGGGSVIGQAVV